MRTIGHANGIALKIPDDSFFSFFNSPYIGHKNQSSIDVYPSHMNWDGSGYSPISGKVVKIRQVKMGKKREFETDEYDYAIGIKPFKDDSSVVRILHCNPSVEVNEIIEAGDALGSMIRSRYFNFWTDPHYHVEVCPANMFHRSSKSYRIEGIFDSQTPLKVEGSDLIRNAKWEIHKITPDYMLAKSSSVQKGWKDGVYGHVAEINSGIKGLIDAGIPHYPHGGILGVSINTGDVILDKAVIGSVKQSFSSHSFFKQNQEYAISVDDTRVRGISTYLLSDTQLISKLIPLKIIPREYNGFSKGFKEGDIFSIRFNRLV